MRCEKALVFGCDKLSAVKSMGQEKREDGGCWLSGTIGSSVMEMS
jgi:hypothetical protein